jgi:hypothetical protein
MKKEAWRMQNGLCRTARPREGASCSDFDRVVRTTGRMAAFRRLEAEGQS